MKNTASAVSPWEKTSSLSRYSRVVFPFSILARTVLGSKARVASLGMASSSGPDLPKRRIAEPAARQIF
jgi:hypothetical protein